MLLRGVPRTRSVRSPAQLRQRYSVVFFACFSGISNNGRGGREAFELAWPSVEPSRDCRACRTPRHDDTLDAQDQLACDVSGCNLINGDASCSLNPDGSPCQLPAVTPTSQTSVTLRSRRYLSERYLLTQFLNLTKYANTVTVYETPPTVISRSLDKTLRLATAVIEESC